MGVLIGYRRSAWSRRGTCLPIMPIQAIDGVVMTGTVGMRGASASEISASCGVAHTPGTTGMLPKVLQGSLSLAG